MAKNLFNDWLKAQPSDVIEQRIARQTATVKTINDNFKALKVELTDRINNNGYECSILKVEGGQTTRADTMNAQTLNIVKDWVLAHVDDKDFLSKVANVAILKEQTGKDEAQLIDDGLCCVALEQYKFKVPKKA